MSHYLFTFFSFFFHSFSVLYDDDFGFYIKRIRCSLPLTVILVRQRGGTGASDDLDPSSSGPTPASQVLQASLSTSPGEDDVLISSVYCCLVGMPSCRQVVVKKGCCTVACRSTDGRDNCKDLFLQEGDELVLEGAGGGVVLSYSVTTSDPATVIITS